MEVVLGFKFVDFEVNEIAAYLRTDRQPDRRTARSI